jgi:N-acetylmuramoyl-L-alanine amidase
LEAEILLLYAIRLQRKIIRLCFILLFIAFLPATSLSSNIIEVTNLRYWSDKDHTRFVFEISDALQFSKNRLSNPDRLYFDLFNVLLTQDVQTHITVNDGIVKAIRIGQFTADTVRVVFDLDAITGYREFFLKNPSRFVIDIYGTQHEKGVPEERADFAKRTIIIDPGHGGHDPGAVGPGGRYEKDIVLDIAFKVQDLLKNNPLYDVHLTRRSDIFIPLEDRTAVANRKNADLFVSIHANASPRRQARGIETYLLNWTDDEEALRVAARENAISLKEMKAVQRKMDIVQTITNDLMRQNKRDESIKLAHYIQQSLVSTLDTSNDLGVKQALFYVLFGAKMPSVLVEVSFISNPIEERLLSKESYRSKVAEAIAKGIKQYFSSVPAFQRITSRENMLNSG